MWWMVRKVQVEWRIASVCAGFVVGVALSIVFHIPLFAGIAGCVAVTIFMLIGRAWTLPLITLGALGVGLGYGVATLDGERHAYDRYIGHSIELTGRIKEDASRSPSGYTSLQLGSVQIRGSPYGGSVFVSIRLHEAPKRGDDITVRGIATAGFGSFALSLQKPEIVTIERQETSDLGRVVRDWFAGHVRTVIDEPQASLGIGYLTGQKSALPEDLAEALRIAGLTHIVVASGYNLTILVRMARKLLLRVSKFSAAMAACGMVAVFIAVTGLSPSMTRAGIVSGLSILFWYYGRKVHPIVLLLFVAALTVAYQPSYTWGDLGWQLSFSAFFGVMVVGPLLQAYFFGATSPGIFRQTLGETIAAHIVTVPIIALQFGTLSHVAIVANMLVVPLVPLAMLLTFISGVWGISGAHFSEIIGMPANFLLEYMVSVAMYVSELSWAQSDSVLPAWGWGIYVVVLGGLCLWLWRATRYNLRTSDLLDVYHEKADYRGR